MSILEEQIQALQEENAELRKRLAVAEEESEKAREECEALRKNIDERTEALRKLQQWVAGERLRLIIEEASGEGGGHTIFIGRTFIDEMEAKLARLVSD